MFPRFYGLQTEVSLASRLPFGIIWFRGMRGRGTRCHAAFITLVFPCASLADGFSLRHGAASDRDSQAERSGIGTCAQKMIIDTPFHLRCSLSLRVCAAGSPVNTGKELSV